MIILKFFEYFRFAGTLSVIGWVGAVVLLVLSRRRAARWRFVLDALTAAVVAWMLGDINSSGISRVTIDTREQDAAARAEQAAVTVMNKPAVEEGAEPQIGVHYAEDGSPELTGGGSGKTNAEAGAKDAPTADAGKPAADAGQSQPPDGNVTNAGADAKGPSYRQRGKQEREEGKKGALDSGAKKIDVKPEAIRYMKADDLIAAKKLDRLNRFAIQVVLLACLAMVLSDYLRGFNAVVTLRWLIPVGGRWLDGFSPRTRMLLVTGDAAAGGLPPHTYAESVLRKGEDVICFSDRDLWPDKQRLARVAIGTWILWGVKKLVSRSPWRPPNNEFLLDGSWFRHYAVVIKDAAEANAVLAELVDLLGERYETGAGSRHAIHLVWVLPEPPGKDVLEKLMHVGNVTNVSLAVWYKEKHVAAGIAAAFDKVLDKMPDPQPPPRVWELVCSLQRRWIRWQARRKASHV